MPGDACVRSFLPAYEMKTPRDLGETLGLLAKEPGAWIPFAGGTDLMVLLEAGKLARHRFLNIWNLADLRGIETTADYLTLGALTTYTEVRRHPVSVAEFSLLCSAAAQTGSVATQNRGTLGGNIANASPAADSPPALIVYDAELEIISAGGSRWTPYHRFHAGYKKMDLRPEELIRRIRLPRARSAWKQYYRKVGARRAQAISKVCFAAAARMDSGRIGDVRIALGSVAPVVFRARRVEQLLLRQTPNATILKAAQDALAKEIAPIDDIRSSARYRQNVARNLLAEFLEVLAG
jgi:CO/xanthine dehydrogenase FAD-binding subunit